MRLFLASLTVHELILLLVQIEQGVQLVQAGGFRCKLFLLGEWLLYLGLCIFKLNPSILQLLDIYRSAGASLFGVRVIARILLAAPAISIEPLVR